ncbi:hypothetical protein BDEG_21142 [Batrachochytrium dendrobatidis JEL423]|uniref:Uncharacterized protein n=1 Tax=Batrachochytrium dendrobatidis (strain JEL423) TaxID=403673 RepID=A0A177WAL1_BATDL|nr:hypothetical protein BDEG_21142 [Batrachochytrium dendrobatidis JEL423]
MAKKGHQTSDIRAKSETIDSVDPSPSPSLNSESFPQATGGPEFPSTSTTQGPGGSQNNHPNQTPGARRKSSKFGTLLRGIGKKHKSGHQKAKKHQDEQNNSIDLLLNFFLKLSVFSHSNDHDGVYGSVKHVQGKSKQHKRVDKVIVKGINTKSTHKEFMDRVYASYYSAHLDMYKKWVKDFLNFLNGVKSTGPVSEFADELVKILEKFLKTIKALQKEIHEIMVRLNKDPSLLEDAVKAILDLTDQFMSRQTDLQQLLEELFGRYSRIDWYREHLEPELGSWFQRFSTVKEYNPSRPRN